MTARNQLSMIGLPMHRPGRLAFNALVSDVFFWHVHRVVTGRSGDGVWTRTVGKLVDG
ncbi:MAG: hypothetical protein ACRDS9_26145 [Pseudonocardiaceae bacterium]